MHYGHRGDEWADEVARRAERRRSLRINRRRRMRILHRRPPCAYDGEQGMDGEGTG